jgi:capsid protein
MPENIKKIIDPVAKYDVLKPNNNRKTMVIETTGEDEIHTRIEKLRSINLARDLHRNHSHTRAMIKQYQDNVIGYNGGKLRLNIKDKNRKEIEKWFNSTWAKNCDARGFETYNSLLKLGVSTLLREGCYLMVFDDFMEDDGKLFFFESDQLVTLNKKDWQKYALKNKFYKIKNKKKILYNQS